MPAPAIRLLELRTTYKWGGGPDKTILLSAARHDPARVAVVVVYIRGVHDREFRIGERARQAGLTYYELVERRKLDPTVIRAVRDIVMKHDINVIHGHDYKTDLIAYLVARLLLRRPIRLLSTAHAWVMLGPRGSLYRRLDLFLMKRFDHLIAVSHATKDEMVQAGLDEGKISVIHNAIDTIEWSREQAPGDLRDELGLTGCSPIVGYVGRIMPEKDLETWIRSASVVAAACPKAAFVLVGDGYEETTRRELAVLATKLGVADRVIFTGFRSDLLRCYATFDVFLLTSRREGLPNSLLESMAMGVPVVTTDVAGAKELVRDGETGFVRLQGDVPALSEAVLTLVKNGPLRSRMAHACRERILHEFSFTDRLHRIEALYAALLEASSASSRPFPPSPAFGRGVK